MLGLKKWIRARRVSSHEGLIYSKACKWKYDWGTGKKTMRTVAWLEWGMHDNQMEKR